MSRIFSSESAVRIDQIQNNCVKTFYGKCFSKGAPCCLFLYLLLVPAIISNTDESRFDGSVCCGWGRDITLLCFETGVWPEDVDLVDSPFTDPASPLESVWTVGACAGDFSSDFTRRCLFSSRTEISGRYRAAILPWRFWNKNKHKY